MHSTTTRFASLLALAASASAMVIDVTRRSPEAGPVPIDDSVPILKPISHYALGRRTQSHEGLDPRQHDSFLYGSNDGTSALANMTVILPDGQQLVSMERFEGLTKSVTCGEKMELEFVSAEALEYAIHAWDWVNENEDDSFVMITNHDGCGRDYERVPYNVYDVDYDEEKFIAHLTAKQLEWKEIEGGQLKVDFGKINQPPTATTPARNRRDLIDFTKNFSIDFAKTFPGSINLFNTTFLSLECMDCGVTGTFDITGRVHFDLGFLGIGAKMVEFYIEASPENLAAQLALQLKAEGEASYNQEINLFRAPIPGAGFSIPAVCTIGASLAYDVGIEASVKGVATVSYGLVARIPNEAIVRADLKDTSASTFSGWTPVFEELPLKAEAEVSGSVSVYSQPSLALGIDIAGGKWGYEAALRLRAPSINAALAVAASSAEVCGAAPGGVGLTIDTSISTDLKFVVGPTDGGDPLWDATLFEFNKPFYSKCLRLAGDAPTPTDVPVVSSAVVVSTEVPVSTGTAPVVVPVATGTGVAPSAVVPLPTDVSAPSNATFIAPGAPARRH